MNKIFISVLLVVVVAVGGYFAWQYWPESQLPADQSINDETADWKTYRNDKYGFEFKYPPNYKIDITGGHSPLAAPELLGRIDLIPQDIVPSYENPILTINPIDPEYFSDINTYINKAYEDRVLPTNDFLDINNIKTVIYESNIEFVGGPPDYFCFFKSGKHILETASESKVFLGKILSTFKFLP